MSESLVLVLSFFSCVLVFFYFRKKVFSILDKHSEKVVKQVEDSERVLEEAKDLLAKQKNEYEQISEKSKTMVYDAEQRALNEKKERKKDIDSLGERKMLETESKMKKERASLISKVRDSVLGEVKGVVSTSLTSFYDEKNQNFLSENDVNNLKEELDANKKIH